MENDNPRPIVVFNRSFYPDIEATGQFLTELCEHLAKKYPVVVVSGRSYFVKEKKFGLSLVKKENYKGIHILHLRHTKFWKASFAGRIINWLTYSFLALIVGLKIKPSIIISATDPPFLGIICRFLKWWHHVPFIYYCMDLYPDVAITLGKINPGIISNLFDMLNKKAFLKSDMVVALSEDMADRIKAKGVTKKQICIITHWTNTQSIRPIPREDNEFIRSHSLDDKFILMYSGNIGLSQGLDVVVDAVAHLNCNFPWKLVFIGEGAKKALLKEKVHKLGLDKMVSFLPYQPREILSLSLSAAHLHLVPLKKGLAGAVVPSKVYRIMAAGRAYLAITDAESNIARFVKEYGCGLWAPPDDVNAIARAIKWAIEHSKELEQMGKYGRNLAEQRFDRTVVVEQWFSLLERMI